MLKNRRFVLLVVLPLLACAAVSQATEKGPDIDKDTNFPVADTTTGNLIGNPTYDRIFTADVDPGCGAMSTLSGNTGTEFEAIPIYTTNPAGENLVATVVPAGTTIGDTVLSLYCNPFDSTDAQANLVAYDDDGGTGLLSAFDGSEGAFLQPNTTYWLVISLFGTTSIGEGDYELSVGGEIVFGQPVPTMDPRLLMALAALLLLVGAVLLARKMA